MVLVDTDVVVDCLRGPAPSRDWLQRTSTEALGLPGVVAMELLIGCRNRAESNTFRNSSTRFQSSGRTRPSLREPTSCSQSIDSRRGWGIPDCLVAAMALVRKARIYTFNSKHFRVIPGVDAQEPYSRQ